MTLIHSLRLRLLLAFTLVALAPVGIVALLVHRQTADAFHSYTDQRAIKDAWSVVNQVNAQTGERVVAVDGANVVLADSTGDQIGQAWSSTDAPQGVLVVRPETSIFGGAGKGVPGLVNGAESGAFTVESAFPGAPPVVVSAAPEIRFLGSVERTLSIAVAAAAVGAILLGLLLTRQILKPIASLTSATLLMAGGDLRQRVDIDSNDEIGTLARAFNTMADSRERLETLRRNLVNDVAHELRSPLSHLQGYLEVLRDGVIEPTPRVLTILHDETLVLSRLVADLQELALADAGQLTMDRQSISLQALISQTSDALRPTAATKQLSLVVHDRPELPPVSADPERLGQVIRNLLSNAIAHTPPGGTIEIDTQSHGNQVSISVRDSGEGIAPEHLPFVFERFYRVDPSRSRETGGAGLGLAIAKQLVDAQGGHIGIRSALAEGTTVTVTLPVTAGVFAVPTPI